MEQTQSPANSAVSSPPVRRSPSVAHFNIETGRFAIMVEVNHDDEPDYAEAYECAAYSGAPGHVNAPGDVALRGLGPIPPPESGTWDYPTTMLAWVRSCSASDLR